MPYTKDYNDYFDKLPNGKIYEVLKKIINEKIASVILKLSNISDDTLKKDLTKEEINLGNQALEEILDNINEIDIDTFETKKINNLFLTGELLDVDGDCGGYNISFAILSGLIVSDRIKELC